IRAHEAVRFPPRPAVPTIRPSPAPALGRAPPTPKFDPMLKLSPGLGARRNSRAGLLSGGEQQMLALARGLMAKPQVLLLDEPSLGLAPAVIDDPFTTPARLRGYGGTLFLVDPVAALAPPLGGRRLG